MPFDDLLCDLLDAVSDYLSEEFNNDDSHFDSVKLIVSEASGDGFTFLLYNCRDNSYRWERKNWYKQNDISQVSNPIGGLKYIGQKIIPNINEQQGITELTEAKEIFSLVPALLELNNNEKNGKSVINGTGYFLQVKLGDAQKNFQWDSVPNGWDNVIGISNKMIELNNIIY